MLRHFPLARLLEDNTDGEGRLWHSSMIFQHDDDSDNLEIDEERFLHALGMVLEMDDEASASYVNRCGQGHWD